MAEQVLVGANEIKKFLGGVSDDTLMRMYRRHRLPIYKREGVWVGNESELTRWLEWWREEMLTSTRPARGVSRRVKRW